jgi:hypothetical protein
VSFHQFAVQILIWCAGVATPSDARARTSVKSEGEVAGCLLAAQAGVVGEPAVRIIDFYRKTMAFGLKRRARGRGLARWWWRVVGGERGGGVPPSGRQETSGWA